MTKLLLCLLFLFTCGFATPPESPKKIIELVPTFIPAPDSLAATLTEALAKQNCPLTVVSTDLSHYRKALAKDRSFWSKWLQKFHLDSVKPIPVGDSVAKIAFWNISSEYLHHYQLDKLPVEKMILFMWEPPTCLHYMFNPKYHRFFGRIYTWDDDLIDNKHYFKLFYPVLQPMISTVPSFEEKKLCTLVGTYIVKAQPKKYPKELYSEREKAITYFEEQGETGFEFYGRGWDSHKHPSYRGAIGDKIDVIKNYRFSICYENTRDVRGYITEKIFDCFAAGNVPIYWGASNITDYIPKTCFIDRRDFATLEELHAFIKNMSKERYEAYLEAIRAFLSSDQAKPFSQEHFLQTAQEAFTS